MRKLILAAVAASAFAAPALAQDDVAAPDDRPYFNGLRAGGLFGYDSLRPGSSEDSDIAGDQTADGLLYGGEVGFDKVIGRRLVIGIEGDVTGSTSKVTNRPFNPNDFGFGRVRAGRDFYGGARVGLLFSPRTMVYAKGGYTNARLDLTASDGLTITGRRFLLDGFRVGAGIEQAMTRHSYIKVEYRYSNYGNARLEFPSGANTNNFSVDTDRHQVAFGVGFRF